MRILLNHPPPPTIKLTIPINMYYLTEGIHSPVTKHVSAPVDRPQQPNVGGLPVGQNICAECERLIV